MKLDRPFSNSTKSLLRLTSLLPAKRDGTPSKSGTLDKYRCNEYRWEV